MMQVMTHLPTRQLPYLSRIPKLAGCLLGISVAAVVSPLSAAGVDGIYRMTAGSGFLKGGGQTTTFPKSMFTQMLDSQANRLVVKKNRVFIDPNMTAALYRGLMKDEVVTINPMVTGPSSFKMLKVGTRYAGKTRQPIITKFTITKPGAEVCVTLETYVGASTKGDTLTLTTRFTGTGGTEGFVGEISLAGKRITSKAK
jgi:hypothetical protein